MRPVPTCIVLALLISPLPASAGELPDEIFAPGEIPVANVHAVGAQVYECKVGANGHLVWQFREPIATLFIAGKTVGRHYAGPSWEMTDGSAVSGTRGGAADGMCDSPGAFLSVPYTADYAFYRKRD